VRLPLFYQAIYFFPILSTLLAVLFGPFFYGFCLSSFFLFPWSLLLSLLALSRSLFPLSRWPFVPFADPIFFFFLGIIRHRSTPPFPFFLTTWVLAAISEPLLSFPPGLSFRNRHFFRLGLPTLFWLQGTSLEASAIPSPLSKFRAAFFYSRK